jgi:hypothetical protein
VALVVYKMRDTAFGTYEASRGRPPKLSESEVQEIIKSRLTIAELASLYGVSKPYFQHSFWRVGNQAD